MRKIFLICWVSAGLAAGTFDEKVLPILKVNCLPCHDEQTRNSGFSIQTLASVINGGVRHGQAVKPGLPAESPLLRMLSGQLTPRMPLGRTLRDTEIAVIREWIRELKAGDVAPETPAAKYWAYVPPVRRDPPPVRNSVRVQNPIDHFILKRLEDKGLEPAAEADRRVLIRRLYFDLIGLPPTPEAVQAFVEDASPKAYEKLVDSLLERPQYGERWGRRWLDLARYADTNGYEGDPEFFHAWRYRDYVIDAFNRDKPYDLFIKEQLAGDEFAKVNSAGGMPAAEPEGVVALTFLRLAPFTEPRGEESRDSLLTEMVTTTSTVFLGLTVGCAKCHDHKYDRIPARDFYRMKAFFASVYIAPPRADDSQQLGGPQPAKFYRPGEKERIDQLRAVSEKKLAATEAEYAVFNKELLTKLESKKRENPEPGKSAENKPLTLDDLKRAIKADEHDKIFTAEEKREFASFSERVLRLKKEVLRLEPLAMSLRNADDPPYGTSVPTTYVLNRGNADAPGEPVQPGFLSAITGNSDPVALPLDRYKRHPTRGRRLTLAEWIASPDNPLTARVLVNRLWQNHFGRGIVETASDFGKNGSAPTHPELLDWLATQFVQEKWSIKAMQRLILNSATYRQSSTGIGKKPVQADPDNRLLSRFPRLRMEGEVIRDSVLAVSGRLNLEAGGPAVYPPLPAGLDEAQKVQGENTWVASDGPDGRRRSIYVFQRRSSGLPLLDLFDASVPNASCDRRRHSITPLQALTMYDSDFVNTEAKYFADRVRNETGPDIGEQIRRAFLIAFGRPPKAGELERVQAFQTGLPAKDDALLGLCRVLLNSSEFLYVD